jgi:hypothetical protein
MRAVAIKKGQSREKAAVFQEMGTLRCDGCGESSSSVTSPRSWIRRLPKNKQCGWKRCLRKSTSATRNTPTESTCRTDLREPSPKRVQIMDRKLVERFKRALQIRQRELRLGLAQVRNQPEHI